MKAGWNAKRVYEIADVLDGPDATPKMVASGSDRPDSFDVTHGRPVEEPKPTASVRPELVEGRQPTTVVHPEPFDRTQGKPVEEPKPTAAVRPELVEGRQPTTLVHPEPCDPAQADPGEGWEPFVRPSTSSGRTEGEGPR